MSAVLDRLQKKAGGCCDARHTATVLGREEAPAGADSESLALGGRRALAAGLSASVQMEARDEMRERRREREQAKRVLLGAQHNAQVCKKRRRSS